VKFLIGECLHTSLVAVAEERGHEARHVNWLGLSGETDWDLMPRIIAELEDGTAVISRYDLPAAETE
jgi:hypothetical protein